MFIKKLLIQNYKRFKSIEIDINPDTNIFVGENDSGKTTIWEALIMVLTGKNKWSAYTFSLECGLGQ